MNKLTYGKAPDVIGEFIIELDKYMFYMYQPIKMPQTSVRLEKRIEPLKHLIHAIIENEKDIDEKYVYLTIKHQFHPKGLTHNRPNWHSDGFGTDDVNYILYSNTPTEFCLHEYENISDDHRVSLVQFEEQSEGKDIFTYPNFTLLKLTPENIHRVAEKKEDGARLFIKISVSDKKYALKGNTKNYLFDDEWKYNERQIERNNP